MNEISFSCHSFQILGFTFQNIGLTLGEADVSKLQDEITEVREACLLRPLNLRFMIENGIEM
jgi:hypothetical protein